VKGSIAIPRIPRIVYVAAGCINGIWTWLRTMHTPTRRQALFITLRIPIRKLHVHRNKSLATLINARRRIGAGLFMEQVGIDPDLPPSTLTVRRVESYHHSRESPKKTIQEQPLPLKTNPSANCCEGNALPISHVGEAFSSS